MRIYYINFTHWKHSLMKPKNIAELENKISDTKLLLTSLLSSIEAKLGINDNLEIIQNILAEELNNLYNIETAATINNTEETLYIHCANCIDQIIKAIAASMREGEDNDFRIPALYKVLTQLIDLSSFFPSSEKRDALQNLLTPYLSASEKQKEPIPVYYGNIDDGYITFELPPYIPHELAPNNIAKQLLRLKEDTDTREYLYTTIKTALSTTWKYKQRAFNLIQDPLKPLLQLEAQYNNDLKILMDAYFFSYNADKDKTLAQQDEEFLHMLAQVQACCQDPTFNRKTTDAEIPSQQYKYIATLHKNGLEELREQHSQKTAHNIQYLQQQKKKIEDLRCIPAITHAEQRVQKFCTSQSTFTAYAEAIRNGEAWINIEIIKLYAEKNKIALYLWRFILDKSKNQKNKLQNELELVSQSLTIEKFNEATTSLNILYDNNNNFWVLNSTSILKEDFTFQSEPEMLETIIMDKSTLTSNSESTIFWRNNVKETMPSDKKCRLSPNRRSISELQEINEKWQNTTVYENQKAVRKNSTSLPDELLKISTEIHTHISVITSVDFLKFFDEHKQFSISLFSKLLTDLEDLLKKILPLLQQLCNYYQNPSHKALIDELNGKIYLKFTNKLSEIVREMDDLHSWVEDPEPVVAQLISFSHDYNPVFENLKIISRYFKENEQKTEFKRILCIPMDEHSDEMELIDIIESGNDNDNASLENEDKDKVSSPINRHVNNWGHMYAQTTPSYPTPTPSNDNNNTSVSTQRPTRSLRGS